MHKTFFYLSTTNQVKFECRQFRSSYAYFWTLNEGNTQLSALFCCMLWHIEPKSCILLFLIKYECRQFASIFVGGMPLLNLEYRKYAVFCTFLLHVHALIYWDENLHMTSFYYTTASIFLGATITQPSHQRQKPYNQNGTYKNHIY